MMRKSRVRLYLYRLTGLLLVLFASVNSLPAQLDSLQERVALARRAGDRQGLAWALIDLAEFQRTRTAESNRYLREACALGDTLGEPRLMGVSAARRVFSEYQLGNYLTAISLARRAQSLLDSLGLKSELARMMLSLGATYSRMGDHELARAELNKGIAIAREVGDTRSEGGFLNNLGESHKRAGDYAAALEYYRLSLELYHRTQRPTHIQLDNLGEVSIYLGRLPDAERYLGQSLAQSRQLDDQRIVAASLCNLGRLALVAGQPGRAVPSLSQSAQMARAQGLLERELECSKLLVQAYERLRQPREAYTAQERYLILVDSLSARQSRLTYQDIRGSLEIQRSRYAILDLDRELRINRWLQYSLAGGVALLVVTALIVAAGYRRSQEDVQLASRQREQLRLAQAQLRETEQAIRDRRERIESNYAAARQRHDEIEHSLRQNEQQALNVRSSFEYAGRIQQAMQPTDERLRALFSGYFLLRQPRELVSGDFLFVHESSHNAVVAVGDCAGSGVAASLLGMIADSMLTQLVIDRGIIDAGTLLTELNRGFRRALVDPSRTVSTSLSIALLVVDRLHHSICYAGANMPLRYMHRGRLYVLQGAKASIGAQTSLEPQRGAATEFVANYLMYDDSHRFFLTSEGFARQRHHETKEAFGEARLDDFITNTAGLTLPEQGQSLQRGWQRWKGAGRQSDDLLMLGFTV